MRYFKMFPLIPYDAKGDGKPTLMTDIFRRVKLTSNLTNQVVDFDYYNVQDGETPEMIAYKYYGDSQLHWTILVVNDIVDYYHDWPMSVQRFEQYIKEKYTNPQAIHHYEITQTSGDTTETIDVGMNVTDYGSAAVVSNYQYEQKLQGEKRQIRLIQPRFIGRFVEDYETKLGE